MDTKEYMRRYYLAHKEKATIAGKKWRAEHKQEMKLYDRERRIRLGEELKEKKRVYYAKNREAIRKKQNDKLRENPKANYARVIAWRKANPEKYKALSLRGVNKRRALKLKTEVGPIDYRKIVKDANGLCAICKLAIEGKFEYDHIIPLSKGGPHTQENIQLTHPTCNRMKSAKIT